MQLQPGDILLHLIQTPYRNGSPSGVLNHAMIYVGDNNIAHSIFNNHQRGVRLHHYQKFFNERMIQYDKNEHIVVFHPTKKIADALVALTLKFAINSTQARSYINYKLKSDENYRTDFTRNKSAYTKNGNVDVRYASHVGALLPTPYNGSRHIEFESPFMQAVNYLRAMRTCERAKSPSATWQDDETNHTHLTFSLSRHKGMGCDDFVMYLIFAALYESHIDESFKQAVKPITDNIWALHRQGYKLKQQIAAEKYYYRPESQRRYSIKPEMEKSENLYKLQAQLQEQEKSNPILKIFNQASRGRGSTLAEKFFIPLSKFTDSHPNECLFEMYQLTWPSLQLLPITSKPKLSKLSTITTPTLSQKVFDCMKSPAI